MSKFLKKYLQAGLHVEAINNTSDGATYLVHTAHQQDYGHQAIGRLTKTQGGYMATAQAITLHDLGVYPTVAAAAQELVAWYDVTCTPAAIAKKFAPHTVDGQAVRFLRVSGQSIVAVYTDHNGQKAQTSWSLDGETPNVERRPGLNLARA